MPNISFHSFVLAEVKVRAYGFKTDLIWDALKRWLNMASW